MTTKQDGPLRLHISILQPCPQPHKDRRIRQHEPIHQAGATMTFRMVFPF